MLKTNIRGRHTTNSVAKISPATTGVCLSSVHDGTVNLRIDDNQHLDFWMEFGLDIPTLEMLLAKAKNIKGLQHLLFPQLEGDSWARVDLNAIALDYDKSPIRSTAEQDTHWIEQLHKKLGVDHSWGGYLEHRDHLLRHHYNKDIGTDYFWHLGIDYNVPVHTYVHLPIDAELVYSAQETDQNGGWGGKLIFKSDAGYFILGHLDGIATEYRKYTKGETIGRIGASDVNGNWFPHLHIQCMKELEDVHVDGYSHWYAGIRRDFPNPVTFFGDDKIDKANEMTEKILVFLSHFNKSIAANLERLSPEDYDAVEDEIAEIINEGMDNL